MRLHSQNNSNEIAFFSLVSLHYDSTASTVISVLKLVGDGDGGGAVTIFDFTVPNELI